MRKVIGLLVLILFSALPALAQISDCDAMVVDNAGVMGAKSAAVAAAAQALVNEGADVHVVTIAQSQNLDINEKQLEQNCQTWQSGDGKRKNTLIVLMVAPKDHKIGIYYGGAWHRALDDHWDRIKKDYIGPRFRDGDFAGGFIVGLQQLDRRIAASRDEAIHPVVAQTTNVVQPTDYSGLWHFLMWSLIIVVLGASIAGVYFLFIRKKEEETQTGGAQQRAQLAKGTVANRLRRVQAAIDGQKAIGNSLAIAWGDQLGVILEHFSDLASGERTDPNQTDLSTQEYDTLTELYNQIGDELGVLEREMATSEHEVSPEEVDPPRATDEEEIRETLNRKATQKARAATASEGATHSEHTTTVIPIPIPYPVEEPREEREEPVEYHHHSSDDDSSSGGGSSSYGGSDSGGGGSSDWGSSDSGGGGSSDSGSSDSGGGGSSDY